MSPRERRVVLLGALLGLSLAAAFYLVYSAVHAKRSATPVPGSSPSQETGAPSPASVELNDQEQRAIGVETVEVTRRAVRRDVVAVGRVEEAETGLRTVSARIGGRIDSLLVNFTGEAVRRGQPVAVIYSPEVVTTAEEYRLALANRKRLGPGAHSEAVAMADELVAAGRRRLELWGLTPQQVEELGYGRRPRIDITIYSPESGIVRERKVAEGQYVKEGDVLYTLVELSTIWVKAELYEPDLPLARVGQAAEISSETLPGGPLRGAVGFIEPQLNPQTRTVAVRIQVPNPGLRLRPGMFVNVKLVSTARNVLAVPRDAVVETGTRKIVYVARDGGVFESRQIEAGPPGNDYYPVLSGLREGERVVARGAFLIDSQTRLGGGMTGLFGGSKEFARANLRITLRTDPDPPKGAAQNTFRVSVLDSSGKPLSDAQVKVTLIMPAMPSMGMAEMRASADLGWNGSEYAGRAQIPMAGSWNVTVEVRRGGQALGSYRTRLDAK